MDTKNKNITNKYFIYNNEVRLVEEVDDNSSIFLGGKSLYEVIRVIDKTPLFLEKHLSRLSASAKLMNLELPMTEFEIISTIKKLVDINNVEAGNIKLVFKYDEERCNSIFYFLKHHYPSVEQYDKGVSTVLYHGERSNPNAKVVNNSFREQVDSKLKVADAYEAILVDRNGNITEGSKSNIFIIKGQEVITSPLDAVLPGITREYIIEACRSLQLTVKEEFINYKDLKEVDALFISGTSPKVLPINKVDNMEYASANNEVLVNIRNKYDDILNNYIKTHKSK